MAYTIEDLRTQFKVISAHINANKDLLIELDSALGDGDLGLTMSTGFEAAVEALEADAGEDLGKTLMQVGMAVNNKAPSTMGTLISSAILRAARVVKGKAEFDDQDCVEMAKAAVQGIKDRGKAERGDKTILDSLIPAVEALEARLQEGASIKEALEDAAQAAKEGFEATAEMVSQKGRGHYYGEKSRGHKDPGAAVGMLIFEALSQEANK
ncbi:dihydroxyacetone kinase subunit DhaL [Candidatus Darwinibacter acetoxidans]|jgi:dihydroxyacetone kinase-like protein|nr:dihydroxyacetone kinase subunit L [Bacillota bacterium]